MKDKLKKTLNNALKMNSAEALRVITEAITSSSINEDMVKNAVNDVVNNYEVQLRIFMIALGKDKIRRIVKLMELSSSVEEALYRYSELGDLDPKDLVAYYSQLNRQLKNEQEFVKTVTDQRLEIMNAMGAMSNVPSSSGGILDESTIIDKLDPVKRDRVRRLVEGVLERSKVGDINSMSTKELESYLLGKS